MKIQYSIEKNDILVNHLYVISKMEKFGKDKKEIFFVILGFLSLINIVVLYKKKYFDFCFFIAITLLFIFFHKKAINFYYKFYSNWNVKKLIKKNPKILGVKEFEFIEKSKITTETINIIDLTLINSINEIKEYYFIRLKNNTSIIIPKAKITSNNKNEINQFLKQLSENLNIEYIKELDWKW